ncbi:MAG: FkbM family methyltransferase [Chloroflexi bacterium]|nr:FkbM family methyltransferase [Chloroflexota bacterium]
MMKFRSLALSLRRAVSPAWRRIDMICGVTVIAPKSPGWERVRTFRWYELDTELFFAATIPAGGTVIDVGANEGVLTAVAARIVGPDGRVIAFEPSPGLAALARRVFEANGLDNVVLEEAAAGAANSTLRFEPARNGAGYAKAAPTGFEVETVALVDYCRERGICPDVIKIDVDGPEISVLEGLSDLLEGASRPTLVVELSNETERLGYSWSEILSFVREQGYSTYASRMKFARVLPVTSRPDFETIPVRFERGDAANLFCTPVPLTAAQREQIWPQRFVPPAYYRHYLSERPFSSPAAFWKAYQREIGVRRS